MNTKILVIGQAPPAVAQDYPYSTTMLYEWFADVGVSKEKAQELFEFDAVYDKFPGHGKRGHAAPNWEQMEDYYKRSLKAKIKAHDKIIVLGNVAKDFILEKVDFVNTTKNIKFLMHPSRRNQWLYPRNKNFITIALNELLNDSNS